MNKKLILHKIFKKIDKRCFKYVNYDWNFTIDFYKNFTI